MAAAILLSAACANSPDRPEAGSAAQASRTYYDDALPVLAKHCGSCHQEGAIAPFRIDDYESAATWADAIVESVEARTMPPFAVDNSGECNTFAHANWLSDDEISILAEWAQEGAVAGEPPAQPVELAKPSTLSGDGLEDVSTPLYSPKAKPDSGEAFDDYQCFLVPIPADRERYIVGFEVLPGNAAILHHVLGFKVNTKKLVNAATMKALDDASPDEPGWDCYGAAGENVLVDGVPVSWAPGAGATEFPAGTGVPFTPDDVLVVQVHYNLLAGDGPDQSVLRLKFADEVERPAVQALWDAFLYSSIIGEPESIAGGVESAKYSWDATIAEIMEIDEDTEVDVWGLLPHMHKRGRKMSIQFESADGMMCGANVDRYDFAWQRAYFYDKPLTLRASDRVHVTCDWDTRDDSGPVLPGFGTGAEMCLLGLYVVPK